MKNSVLDTALVERERGIYFIIVEYPDHRVYKDPAIRENPAEGERISIAGRISFQRRVHVYWSSV